MPRSLFLGGALMALVSACGARTISDEYREDAGVIVTDLGPVEDSPAPRPDRPTPPDTGVCVSPRVQCPSGCVDVASDPNNCGICGLRCPSDTMCVGRNCVRQCPPGTLECAGVCVDPRIDRLHCGGCGRVCAQGTNCVMGDCQFGMACGPGEVRCSDGCTTLLNDPRNCGSCDVECAGGVCREGACTTMLVCPPGQTLCDGVCVSTQSSREHCGACGRRCSGDEFCQGSQCQRGRPNWGGEPFQVLELSADGCTTIEHNGDTGDDRGGIAVTNEGVAYTGDNRTAWFDPTLVPRPRGAQVTLDAMVSDLRDNVIFTFARNGIPFSLASSADPSTLNQLIAFNNTGRAFMSLPLSRPITLRRSGSNPVGIYAGYGRIVIHDDTSLFHITTATGEVTEVPFTSILPRQQCESWATWGVVEYDGSDLHLLMVRDQRTIVRYSLATGRFSTVATFESLSDMCSFTVHPQLRRWFFHHEGMSQFRSGDETLGTCRSRTTRG